MRSTFKCVLTPACPFQAFTQLPSTLRAVACSNGREVPSACVQIEGFKKALSKGGGAKNFLRFLSRKKDGTQAASADTITLDDMLTFSPVRSQT